MPLPSNGLLGRLSWRLLRQDPPFAEFILALWGVDLRALNSDRPPIPISFQVGLALWSLAVSGSAAQGPPVAEDQGLPAAWKQGITAGWEPQKENHTTHLPT